MLKVCGYTRVSTKRLELSESLENQITYYTETINENPEWQFAGIYVDKDSGESATKRKDFQRMLKDCEKGKIDLIVTKNCKRFARNVVECLEIIRRLKRLKVGVYFEQERINTLETSEEFFITLSEVIGEHELKSHSENVKIGIRYLFQRGMSLQSFRVLGYEREGVRGLKIIPHEAQIVRRVFELYCNGVGSSTIARMLNDGGYKTIEGLPYKSFTILYMIENEKYAGNCLLQKVYKKNYRDYINTGEVDQYFVQGTHEPIVTQDIWDKAQSIRAGKAEKGKKKRVYYNPFKRYVFCRCCGLAYQLYLNNPDRVAETYTLKCYGRIQNGKSFCDNRSVRLATMKALFIKLHNDLIGSKNIIASQTTSDATVIAINAKIRELLDKEKLFMQMEVKGLLNEESAAEYKKLIEHLKHLDEEKAKWLLQETNETYFHQQSKELEKYFKIAYPLVEFDEDIFKKMISQITVITNSKIEFTLANEQKIVIEYTVGKYKNDDKI